MVDRQKRKRSSPSGETPVQEFKRPLRKPWSLEEKDFLQTFVETAGGVPKTNTMRFWEKCAEEFKESLKIGDIQFGDMNIFPTWAWTRLDKRMNNNVNIYPCGICVSPWSPWLAASPDRKVYCPSLTPCYGLLEIKCPVNPLSQNVYLNKDENGFKLKRTLNYFHHIMMQLAVTGLEWCYLFFWTSNESHLELITFDSSRWQEMKDRLDMFYFDHYLKG